MDLTLLLFHIRRFHILYIPAAIVCFLSGMYSSGLEELLILSFIVLMPILFSLSNYKQNKSCRPLFYFPIARKTLLRTFWLETVVFPTGFVFLMTQLGLLLNPKFTEIFDYTVPVFITTLFISGLVLFRDFLQVYLKKSRYLVDLLYVTGYLYIFNRFIVEPPSIYYRNEWLLLAGVGLLSVTYYIAQHQLFLLSCL